ncbi:MAG: hypothetical protein AAF787_00940 [Chloroflexota bacterium]
MNFLKNLFGGGNGASDANNDRGIYVYVRPRGCEEVIRVRLDPANDLSNADGGYFVRKIARGNHRCFDPVEMSLYFDNNRKLVENDITGGELVEKADFEAWEAKLAAKKAAIKAKNDAVDAQREEA